jgi:flagellar L-ring protein precursor FlgH
VKKLLFLACLGLGPLVPNPASADSIWDRRESRSAFLFEDNRARRIGDLLTITIMENTSSNDNETRNLNKNTDGRVQTNYTGNTTSTSPSGTVGVSGALNFDLRNRSNRTFNGTSTLTSDRTFNDKMAVTVIDIMPNGNLVVEGYRTRVVQGEERQLRITGVVRPADIGLQNTVRSEFVANFKISYMGRGPQSSFVNQGYFSRLMNGLWPW